MIVAGAFLAAVFMPAGIASAQEGAAPPQSRR